MIGGFHPGTGFIELEPLAIGVVDLVWVVIALACLLVVAAGWVFFAVVAQVFSSISVLGAKPFGFIAGLLQDAMKALAGIMMARLDACAHFFWSLAQTIWRPLYVIGATLAGLAAQIVGVSQSSQEGLAQLRAKEQSDINTLDDVVARYVDALSSTEKADIAALNHAVNADVARLEGEINTLGTGLSNDLNLDVEHLQANINDNYNALNRALNTIHGELQNSIDGNVSTLNATINRDVADLTREDASTLAQARTFALGAITSATPGIVAQAEAALQPQLSKITTDINECLDPLCNTVTPNAKKLGHLGNLFQDLENLGVEALIVALAVEAVHNPQAVVGDISSTVQDVGGGVLAGFRDLIGI